ncbi:MAG: tetratricopeptide repeat protein [Deltaproteobacteria bacterium]|nr:tetratricopeptide repeat protein [Deltaproteobacteria bacterium]
MNHDNPHVTDATSATFEAEVLTRSHDLPVLVDFWADWCAPCLVLGPVLEAAVEAHGGAVRLVKVNADDEPALAARFGVRGIPAVKAFVGGQVVAEFVGAQDRRSVDAFIAKLCPPAEERTLADAEKLVAEGSAAEAESRVAPLLDAPHYGARARLLSARAAAARGAFAAARERIAPLADEEGAEGDAARALLLRLELREAGASAASPQALEARLAENPKDSELRWTLAGRHYTTGDLENAVEALLELLQRDRRFRQDGARRALLALFDELGSDHPLARDARRRMQIYL